MGIPCEMSRSPGLCRLPGRILVSIVWLVSTIPGYPHPAASAGSRAPTASSQALGAEPGQAAVQPESRLSYSRKQLRNLLRDARTPRDHERLGAYFRMREREYRAKEVHEREALADYLKRAADYPSKYPTRGDIASGLAAHYDLQARKAAALATEHERMVTELRERK